MKVEGSKKQSTILLAEDDKAIIEVMKIILQDAGYHILVVQHYKELKKVLDEQLVSLVMLDLSLSGESGSEICRTIKSDDRTKHIPVIILSAHQQVEQIAKSVFADDVLQKPFDIDVLLNKVKRFISV